MGFRENVFVNCPFDDQYLPLLRPLLFTIIYLGLKPRIALEVSDSGEPRLAKIVQLVSESRFGIHDLSRLKAERPGEISRFNMPFELGLDFGCRLFGTRPKNAKRCLVLETDPHRYRIAISDLSGSDIESHGDEPYRVVAILRSWFQHAGRARESGPARIWGAFQDFTTWNYQNLSRKGFSSRDIENLSVPELIACMEDWVAANPA